MARTKVFISYCRKDEKSLDQLRPFLKSLERYHRIDVWDDTRLRGGDDWLAGIEQALDDALAAVLLISQDFLASDFVVEKELPRILAAEDAGELTVIPVFLRPSTVDELEIPFHSAEGEERRMALTRFQGFGKPERPFSDLSWSDRERAYGELTTRLRQLAGQSVAPSELGPRSASRRTVTREPSRLYVLTVRLERRAGELHTEYSLPGLKPLASASIPWDGLCRSLELVNTALNQNRSPIEAGDVLFETLFGPEERWGPILRTLFGRQHPQPQPNPPWAPVRLRICTDESLLLGLPWRLTTWKERILVQDGWTFTTTSVADPTEDHATTAPSSVLVVALGDSEHADAVVDLLKKVWPTRREAGYVRVVKTSAEILNALRGMRPHVLYLYGDRGDEDPVDLAKLFRDADHRPDVVYLNTSGISNPGTLLGDLPLVIWRQLPQPQVDSTTRSLTWLRRWLGEGDDPVDALHEVTKGDVTSSAEAATLAIHSVYRTWKTSTYLAVGDERLPHLRLDRDQQKALVAKHVSELARSDSRRVMSLVAYAAEGNTVSTLAEQLRDYLELAVFDLVEINWIRLEFPVGRSRLRRDLEYELQLQLRADDNEPVPHLLRRYAPTVVGTAKRAIVWLDWGTFGADRLHGQQPPLKPAQLGAWLRFSSEYLGIHCPDDLRIVSYLAIETGTSKHTRLGRSLQEHRREPWCRRSEFRLSVLPPLGQVSEDDLFDFLDEARNSTCDAAIHAEIAERLVAETGGEFEATVALMREAEKGSWYDLLTRLRRSQGAEASVADEEPF